MNLTQPLLSTICIDTNVVIILPVIHAIKNFQLIKFVPWLSVLLAINTGINVSKIRFSKHSFFNPIQDGGLAKETPPTSFFPVTSTNVRISHYNFLIFSFNPFVTLVQNFKFVPSASPKLLNLNQDHPSKKAIFLVKSL